MSKVWVLILETDYFMSLSDTLYSVTVSKHTKKVHVTCIGMECVDNTLKGCYHCLNDLPSWVQGKIAILTLCEDGQDVRKVGKRINDMTFWIYG